MQTNTAIRYVDPTNNEGVPTTRTKPIDQLRRTVLSCLLFERTFYEDGVTIAERIKALAEQCGAYIAKLRTHNGVKVGERHSTDSQKEVALDLDQRWISTGATDLQKGWMCIIRGIAQPTTF